MLVGLEPVSQEKDMGIDLLLGLELVSYRRREGRPSDFPGERGEVIKTKISKQTKGRDHDAK